MKKIKLTALLVVILVGVALGCKAINDKVTPPAHWVNKPFQDQDLSWLLHLLEDYL